MKSPALNINALLAGQKDFSKKTKEKMFKVSGVIHASKHDKTGVISEEELLKVREKIQMNHKPNVVPDVIRFIKKDGFVRVKDMPIGCPKKMELFLNDQFGGKAVDICGTCENLQAAFIFKFKRGREEHISNIKSNRTKDCYYCSLEHSEKAVEKVLDSYFSTQKVIPEKWLSDIVTGKQIGRAHV